MKKKLILIASISLLFIQACVKRDCEEILCFTPPRSFVFEIVDKESGENLFTNGTYKPVQIKVINLVDNTNKEFTFIDENEINIISIASIGWDSEIAEIVIRIANEDIVNLYVDSERVNENCCNFSQYNEIRVENANYDYDEQSEVYTILMD